MFFVSKVVYFALDFSSNDEAVISHSTEEKIQLIPKLKQPTDGFLRG